MIDRMENERLNLESELNQLQQIVPNLKNKNNQMEEILEGTAVYISQLQRQLAAKIRTHGCRGSTGPMAGPVNHTASADEIIRSLSLLLCTKRQTKT